MHPLIPLFVTEAAPILDAHFAPDSCVNSTRVVLDVFAHYKVYAYPLAVSVVAANAGYMAKLDETGDYPATPAVLEAWHAENGAHALGIDTKHETVTEHDWHGHVVAMVHGTLIDAAASLMNRPHHKIRFDRVLALDMPAGWAGGGRRVAATNAETATTIFLEAMPHVKTYRTFPGFTKHKGNVQVSREIIRALDKARHAHPRQRA